MSKKALKERWSSPLNGEQLGESPFGMIDNKHDFRYVELVRPLRNFKLIKADLTGSFLKVGQFTHVEAHESVLDEVKFTGTIFGDAFTRCEFNKSILDITFCDVTFNQCIFNCVNFKKSSTNDRVMFKNTTFVECDLNKVQFMDAEFRNCIFKNCKTGMWASFAFSKFIGCDLSEMDFGNAIMDDVVIE